MLKIIGIYTCIALAANCFISSYARAFPDVYKIQDTVVDTEATTLGSGAPYGYSINGLSFQQEAVWTHNGWQYITYYNRYRHVCLARRQLPSGAWQKIEFTDYTLSTTTDAHNVVTLGICPNDGTIHLSFDHHGGTLHYRVSEAGVATNPGSITWSTARFGPVRNYLESGKSYSSVTYPSFWKTPDGNLQFGYRIGSSGNGDFAMVDYNGTTGLWHDTRTLIIRTGTYSDSMGTSTHRNPYMNNIGYGPGGKLYVTWCWREEAGGANHDIMYAFSYDGGYEWLNGLSNTIKIFTRSPEDELQTMLALSIGAGENNIVRRASGSPQTITLNSPWIKVVTLDRFFGLMNQQTQAVDPMGRIHTVMFHCTPITYEGYTWSTWGPLGARRYFHYWRDAQDSWHCNELPGYVGSRPKLFIRSNGDAFLIYQSRRNINLNDTGLYFTDGDLTVQAATAAAQWTDWQIIHTETGYFLNEMLGDPYRFEQENILSVMVQETPGSIGGYSKLRILDFSIE